MFLALENVKPPPYKRLTGLRRLVVFEQSARPIHVLDRVRRSCEQARWGKVRFRLVFWRSGR